MTTDLLERPMRPTRQAGKKHKSSQYVGDALVRMDWHRAAASVWNIGDGIWGYDVKPAYDIKTYTGVLLVDKDGDWRLMAEIEGPSWASVCRAVEALGFERPKLTAQEVRRGR